MSTNKLGQVSSCSPEAIVVAVDDLKTFEEHKENLQVGRYGCDIRRKRGRIVVLENLLNWEELFRWLLELTKKSWQLEEKGVLDLVVRDRGDQRICRPMAQAPP